MAYDVAKLAAKLTDDMGMNITEEAAKHAVESVFSWVEESAKESAGKVDDFISGIMVMLKPMLIGFIDKIDGDVG